MPQLTQIYLVLKEQLNKQPYCVLFDFSVLDQAMNSLSPTMEFRGEKKTHVWYTPMDLKGLLIS